MIRATTFVLLSTALLLAGCGSSPPVRYFVLEPLSIETPAGPADSPLVVLGPLQLPEYLKRSQMVMRGTGAEMLVDDFNRWAEPLDQAIHRILASNIDGLLGSVVVVAHPSGALADADYRLTGRVERFDVDSDGLAVLALQWSMADADGNMLVLPQRSQYQARAADPGDPAAIAQAMSDTIAQCSRDIASRISSQLH